MLVCAMSDVLSDRRSDATGARALDQVLERHHVVGITGAELLGAFEAGINDVSAAAAAVTEQEFRFLRDHGGGSSAAVLAEWKAEREYGKRVLATARTVGATLADSLSVKETAARLRVDRSRISRRITGRTLWSFTIDGTIRVPSWQFVDDAPLPGLAEIVPSIPPRHAPAAVAALMRTPQEELAGLSPVEHLASGADPAPVAAMLADLGRW